MLTTLRSVAQRFAAALKNAGELFPRGAKDAFGEARFLAARNAAAFRASLGQGAVFAGDDYVVILDPPAEQPPPFAPRCIPVIAVDEPGDALRRFTDHGIALEAFALSDERPDIVQMALESGAVRLTRFGELQKPSPAGNHGGRGRITDFIRWIDREL